MKLKGFKDSDGQVNAILPAGRYYGHFAKVTEEDWAGHEGGKIISVQFVAEDVVDAGEMPKWAQKGAYIFDRIYVPSKSAAEEKPNWLEMVTKRLKNMYNACGVAVSGDEFDVEADLTGKDCIGVVKEDRGGIKEIKGEKKYIAPRNEIGEYQPIPQK